MNVVSTEGSYLDNNNFTIQDLNYLFLSYMVGE